MSRLSQFDNICTAWLINRCGPPQLIQHSQEMNDATLDDTNTSLMGYTKYPDRSASSQGRAVLLALFCATLLCGGGLALAHVWRDRDQIPDSPTYSAGDAAVVNNGYVFHLPIDNSLTDAIVDRRDR